MLSQNYKHIQKEKERKGMMTKKRRKYHALRIAYTNNTESVQN